MHMNIRINIVKIDKMVYNIYRGDIMQIIDQMIAEIVNLFIDFLSKYWLLGGGIILGFFFRCDLYKSYIVIPELRRRKVLTTIVYVMGLTIMWSLLYSNQQDSNIGISTLILTLVYLFVVVAEKCDDGTTESLLLIVNGTMITTLSFQPFPYNIGFALLTILVAWIAYKCWFSFELLSDFIEIVIISVESIIASLIMSWCKWDGILHTIIFVVFCETFLFMINCYLKLFVKKICNEDTDFYWYDIC